MFVLFGASNKCLFLYSCCLILSFESSGCIGFQLFLVKICDF